MTAAAGNLLCEFNKQLEQSRKKKQVLTGDLGGFAGVTPESCLCFGMDGQLLLGQHVVT